MNLLLTEINKDRKATATIAEQPLFIQQEIIRQMASQQAMQQVCSYFVRVSSQY